MQWKCLLAICEGLLSLVDSPHKGPAIWSNHVFIVFILNKLLTKQLGCSWFERQWCSCDITLITHWGWVTHICVGNLTTIGSNNDLSPDRRQATIGTNAAILSIGPLGINFSEISMEIQTFSFRKMCLKLSSAKWRPSCLGLNVLINKN